MRRGVKIKLPSTSYDERCAEREATHRRIELEVQKTVAQIRQCFPDARDYNCLDDGDNVEVLDGDDKVLVLITVQELDTFMEGYIPQTLIPQAQIVASGTPPRRKRPGRGKRRKNLSTAVVEADVKTTPALPLPRRALRFKGLQILEDINEVHLFPRDADPDDIAFGRVKPVKSFPYGKHPKHAYDLAEAYADGYDQRYGDMVRNGEVACPF